MEAITPQQIQKIVPGTPVFDAERIADFCGTARLALSVDSPKRLSAFLAQLAFVTNGFKFFWDAPNLFKISEWVRGNCNSLADANDFRAITRAFNKNLEGYGARLLIYKQALRVLKAH